MKQIYLQQLAKTITQLQTPAEVIEFLKGILTPKELAEISLRLQIIKQLKEGISQRQISENLGVGLATITRGSKELQNGKFKNV
jgi:TrpR family trp operon transcriptional repressor